MTTFNLKYRTLFFIVVGLFVTQFATAENGEVLSSINKLNLRNCTKNRCIQLTAESARSGYISPVMSLKRVKLTILTGAKQIKIESESGYLDFEQNLVSLRVSDKKEVTISLKDLMTSEYKL